MNKTNPYLSDVQENGFGGTVMYTLTGSTEDVRKDILSLEKDYPAAGYGTRQIGKEQRLDNGTIKVFVERSRSSD